MIGLWGGGFLLWYVPQCLTTTTNIITTTIIIIILLHASQSFFNCFLLSVDVHPLQGSALLSLSSLHLTSPPSYTNPLADLTLAYTGERRLQSSSNLLPSRKLLSLCSHRLPIMSYRWIQLKQSYIQKSTHEVDFYLGGCYTSGRHTVKYLWPLTDVFHLKKKISCSCVLCMRVNSIAESWSGGQV